MQISQYRKTQTRSQLHHSHAPTLCTNYGVTRAKTDPHERTLFEGPCQGRLHGDTREVSYHGHSIEVLLTEQRLKKQHCTLGKREPQQGDRTVCVYGLGCMDIRRQEMRAEKMRGSGGRLTSWGAMRGGMCVKGEDTDGERWEDFKWSDTVIDGEFAIS